MNTPSPRRPPAARCRVRRPLAATAVFAVLAFTPASEPERGILYTASPEAEGEQIWLMPVDGSEPRRLTPATPGLHERFPVWSPDGTAIAFLSNRHDPGVARPAVFVMNADVTGAWKAGPEAIPYQCAPHFSPDGQQIVFAVGGMDAGPLQTALYVMDVDGSNVRRLTDRDGFVSCPRWSPDGNLILFSKNIDQLLVVEVASGRVSAALPAGVEGACGDWSPDGTRLAFSSGPDHQLPTFQEVMGNPSFPQEIFVFDMVHGEVTHLPQAGPHATYHRWSRDGERLVFQGHIPPGEIRHPGFMPVPGAAELYTIGADGSGVHRLTHNSRMDGHPSW